MEEMQKDEKEDCSKRDTTKRLELLEEIISSKN